MPAALLALSAGCYAPSASDGKDALVEREREPAPCIISVDADLLADQVLQLVNLERAVAGLPPVVTNSVLEKIAGDYACLMIAEGFFAHIDPVTERGPGQRAVAGRYSFYVIGENLAAGQETAAGAMRVWMESPLHRAIILDPRWKEVGISVRLGGEHGIYWVQEFGDPARPVSDR